MSRVVDLGRMLELTAQIYDAAVDQRLWSGVLFFLHHTFRSEGSVLRTLSPNPHVDDGQLVIGTPCQVPEPWTMILVEEGYVRIQINRDLNDLPFSSNERNAFLLLAPHLRRAARFSTLLATNSSTVSAANGRGHELPHSFPA